MLYFSVSNLGKKINWNSEFSDATLNFIIATLGPRITSDIGLLWYKHTWT